MTCKHDRYRGYPYMQQEAAWKALKKGQVCFIGQLIETCQDCGADLTRYKIRQVATVEDYLKR